MDISMIIGCAIGYMFAKWLMKAPPRFDDACIVAVVTVLINAAIDGLGSGIITDYPATIVGVLLGYAILCLYERIRQ